MDSAEPFAAPFAPTSSNCSDVSNPLYAQNQRIEQLIKDRQPAASPQHIDHLKRAAAQLIHNTLNSAIDVCLVFHNIRPEPIEMCVFDPCCPAEVTPGTDEEALAALVKRVSVQLHQYIRQWVRQVYLKCAIDFVRHWRCPAGDWDTYVFQAKFSVPTRRFPTPQCTASVFFTFDVPDIDRESSEPLMVSYRYQFEGMHYLHEPTTDPKQFDFQEKLLLDILKYKAQLYRQLTF